MIAAQPGISPREVQCTVSIYEVLVDTVSSGPLVRNSKFGPILVVQVLIPHRASQFQDNFL